MTLIERVSALTLALALSTQAGCREPEGDAAQPRQPAYSQFVAKEYTLRLPPDWHSSLSPDKTMTAFSSGNENDRRLRSVILIRLWSLRTPEKLPALERNLRRGILSEFHVTAWRTATVSIAGRRLMAVFFGTPWHGGTERVLHVSVYARFVLAEIVCFEPTDNHIAERNDILASFRFAPTAYRFSPGNTPKTQGGLGETAL